MSLPVSQSQLFAFEENIEALIVAYFTAQGVTPVGRTRSPLSFNAPFVGITFYNGDPILENQRAIPDAPGAYLPWNGYNGRLLTTVGTLRKDDATGSVHTGLLANIRRCLQLFNLIEAQDQEQIDFIIDCRESVSQSDYDDEKDIDYTEITWNIRHSLNPNAWPALTNVYKRPGGVFNYLRPGGSYSQYVRN